MEARPVSQKRNPMSDAKISKDVPGEGTWSREYRSLLEKWRAEGAVDVLPDELERRQEPRFKLKAGSITIQLESRFPVYNMSRSGLCFGSRLELARGQKLRLILEKTFLVDVEVIACDPQLGDHPFRIGCKFVNPEHGLEMLVMLDDLGQLEMDLEIRQD